MRARGPKGVKGRGHHPDPEEDPESAIHVAATEHLAKDCQQRGGERAGRLVQRGSNASGTKTVTTQPLTQEVEENPLDLLCSSDSDKQSAQMISVQDKGSHPKYACVTVKGSPAWESLTLAQISPLLGVICSKRLPQWRG